MVKSTKYYLSNELSKLRLLKRMKKDKPNTIEPDTTAGYPGLVETTDPVETTDVVGTSGCTATPDWCTVAGYDAYPASYPSFNSVCDICADSFHPISCPDAGLDGGGYSSTIHLLEGDSAQGTYTVTFLPGASGEAKMTFQAQITQRIAGTSVLMQDMQSDENSITYYADPLEQWQSTSLNEDIAIYENVAVYFRLQPGQTGENPNGEWFLDQWTDGTTAQAPTSCICKEPTQLVGDDNKIYSLTANSTVHQFYAENPNYTGDSGGNPPVSYYVSFYVTFDGTYVNVFTSNLTTLTANTAGQVIYPTGTNGTTILEVLSLGDTTAEFEFSST